MLLRAFRSLTLHIKAMIDRILSLITQKKKILHKQNVVLDVMHEIYFMHKELSITFKVHKTLRKALEFN